MKQIFQEYFNPFQEENVFLDQSKDFTTRLNEVQEIQKKEQSKELRSFTAFGLIFAVAAFLMILQFLGISNTYSDFSVIIWIALFSATIYTIKRIKSNPLVPLYKELEFAWRKVYARANQTSVEYKKPYRPKVIMGVAANIAEKLGINPSIVRLLLVMLLFIPFLGGGIFISYFILGITQQKKENYLSR